MKSDYDFMEIDPPRQPRSHPLKWKELVYQVESISGDNPDVWIEELSKCNKLHEPELVCKDEDTYAVMASFSVIHDKKNNRITIRHHY